MKPDKTITQKTAPAPQVLTRAQLTSVTGGATARQSGTPRQTGVSAGPNS